MPIGVPEAQHIAAPLGDRRDLRAKLRAVRARRVEPFLPPLPSGIGRLARRPKAGVLISENGSVAHSFGLFVFLRAFTFDGEPITFDDRFAVGSLGVEFAAVAILDAPGRWPANFAPVCFGIFSSLRC
jgi:hypothetical protein